MSTTVNTSEPKYLQLNKVLKVRIESKRSDSKDCITGRDEKDEKGVIQTMKSVEKNQPTMERAESKHEDPIKANSVDFKEELLRSRFLKKYKTKDDELIPTTEPISTSLKCPEKKNDVSEIEENDDEDDDGEEDEQKTEDREVYLSKNLVSTLELDDSPSSLPAIPISPWRAPEAYGLRNSKRIIRVRNKYGELVEVDPDDHETSKSREHKAEVAYQSISEKFNSESKLDKETLNLKSRNSESKVVESESKADDDDDDDDDDEEYDFNGDDDGAFPNITMSANLMKALGMDVSNVDTTTDWKPPTVTGLEHSAPIVDFRHAR
jgi:hypothetical protein